MAILTRPAEVLLLSGVLFAAVAAESADLSAPAAAELPGIDQLPDRPELPDPLTMFDGTKVRTVEEWNQKRRPELKRLFQHYVYGYLPPPPKIEGRVTKEADGLFGGKARLREVEIRFSELEEQAKSGAADKPPVPRIRLALFIPTHGEKPFPVFLGINPEGNHTVCAEPAVSGPEEQRGLRKDFWCVEYLIDRGYAFAAFCQTDIDRDANDFTDGIHPHYNLPGPRETHWGTISAWAWGFHRCVDYLVTDRDVDAKRIAIIGHSRRGKTALWAAALDERIALVVPHQSGTGGMALSRNNNQETVARINRSFPHWFNDVFPRFGGREEKLPVDQHLLTALVAPRPLLETAGLKDTWANYDSALVNLKAASPVYDFLGAPGLVGTGVISEDERINAETCGDLLQYRRDFHHTLDRRYWQAILDFADRHFRTPRAE